MSRKPPPPPLQLSGEAETIAIQSWSAQMRTPRLRTLGQFAEEEIIIPTGPWEGWPYLLSRSPSARLLFAELDSGRWRRVFITGPNQDGKSLSGFVIPTLYLLFERKETVILGVPSLELVADKWRQDLKPAIERSRYRSLMPERGGGSKDGDSTLIRFGNGASLRFMTAGGDDKSRASFTTCNLVVTETDAFDTVGGESREGSKFDQLVRRTLAFADRSRIIAECTVSTENGRTWQEYTKGSTASRISLPCPECDAWVTPEREHLIGWQDAKTDVEAIASARVCCPKCGSIWSEAQRVEANQRAILLHGKQEAAGSPDAPQITGEIPGTTTLGFRWTVVNSIVNPGRLGEAAAEEWRAKRAADEEAKEIEVRQAHWALPAPPAKTDVSKLEAFAIMRRTIGLGRRIAPEKTQFITVGCDVGQRLCHWTATAWREGATPHTLEYDRVEVPTELTSSPEDAILVGLRDWRDDVVSRGWKRAGSDDSAKNILPAFVFVDCGWWPATVLRFIAECQSRGGYFATKGFGIGQRVEGKYKRETGSKVVAVGERYNLIQQVDGQQFIEVSVDYWKSWLHARLQTPIDKPGAFTLFDAGENEHLSFAKHLTAETQVEEFVPGTGLVVTWKAKSRNNHWFDSTVLSCVGGHAAGMRLIAPLPPSAPIAPPPPPRPSASRDGDRSEWMPDRPDRWID